MRITLLGVLVVVGGIALLLFVLDRVSRDLNLDKGEPQ